MPNVKVLPVLALPTAAEATVTLTEALPSSAATSDGACPSTSSEANVSGTGGEAVAKFGSNSKHKGTLPFSMDA